MIEFFTDFFWIVWVVLILAFITIEILSLEFTFLMLALGSGAGWLSGVFGAPWWLQALIAAAAAVLLVLFVRPPLLRALHRGADETPTLLDALIGAHGVVVLAGSVPQVRLDNGETWSARSAASAPLVVGGSVLVEHVEGSRIIVRPTEKE